MKLDTLLDRFYDDIELGLNLICKFRIYDKKSKKVLYQGYDKRVCIPLLSTRRNECRFFGIEQVQDLTIYILC